MGVVIFCAYSLYLLGLNTYREHMFTAIDNLILLNKNRNYSANDPDASLQGYI